MITTLKGTTVREIQTTLAGSRQALGAAFGQVFTLVVVMDGASLPETLEACEEAAREHPSRIVLVSNGSARSDRLDAEIRVGDGVPGEIISLRLHGSLTAHRECIVLPLLLSDSPVVAWWPGNCPESLALDPIGKLAVRRISDVRSAKDPIRALSVRASHLVPGDTDLSWTRLTPWRGLLASALDLAASPVLSATITAEPKSAPAALLAAWLDEKLDIPVAVVESEGPGITGASLQTTKGTYTLRRADGAMASFHAPGLPCRSVALRRRSISQLLTEDLRLLATDETQLAAMSQFLTRAGGTSPSLKSARRANRT